MKQTYPIYYPQFFTATILEWKHLLADDKHKDIIINSLKFLVAEKRIILNAFVIMSNHMHPTTAKAAARIGAAMNAMLLRYY